MAKTEELLAVLDMPEEKQESWLIRNLEEPANSYFVDNSLADLAFRLRDEVCWHDKWPIYYQAQTKVLNKWCKDTWKERKLSGWKHKHVKPGLFWRIYAWPIHWIIASLIAKEKT